MLIRTLFLSLFLSICLVTLSNAQYNQPLSDYVIKVWSAEEGLPSNNLRHVAKDKDGFLWISTLNGLVRFDGNKFKKFNTESVPNLVSNAFYSVLPLPNGNMYIGTQSGGLLLYENGKFTPVPNSENLPKSVQISFIDTSGRLWVGTRNAGVYYLEDDKVTRFTIPGFDNQSIKSFTEDIEGNIWVASEGKGVAKIAEDTVIIYSKKEGLSSNIVNSVLYHDGKIYAGTKKGLSIYENNRWTLDERLDDVKINFIASDENSDLWFATDVGLSRLSHSSGFEYISESDGLPSQQVSSIAFDDENNVWITTKRGGLGQLKLSNFKNISTIDGLSYRGVSVVEEGPNGSFYVGSDNGDIDVIKGGKIKKLPMRKNLESVSIKDLFADDDGTLWIATYDGVIKKSGNKEQYFGVEEGLVSLKTRRILKDSKGIIWVASRNGGLNKIYPDNTVESITVKDGLGSDFAFSVDEAPDGRIVVGTSKGGLNIIHTTGKIEVLIPDSSIMYFSIFNVYIENNERFWLATNVGLFCYQDKKFTLINKKSGLAVETIFDIKEDNSGNLWASSKMGLVRISKRDAIAYIKGETDLVFTSLLNNSDGMISRKCVGATRILQTKGGNLWIPTIKGIAILDPQKLIINLKAPSIFIEDIIVDDERVEKNTGNENSEVSKIVIEPGHRNYSINYTSLSMYSPKKVKFTYKLEGFDKDWIEIGAVREAKYTNIPYGSYTFKVKAANNNGVWSSDYAAINIEIKPYFYETIWFITLLILLFIAATVFIYLYQTKEVKSRNNELIKLNSELDSFAYSVSHDLKAPLSSIKGLLNVAKLEEGKNALKYYKLIDTSVEKLDSFIKDIIDYSKNARTELKKEPVQVRDLISDTLDSLVYLNKEKEVDITLEIDDTLEILTDKVRFTFIANNLLTNAFRYADFSKDKSFVKISANVNDSVLYFSIEDNGQGIEKEVQGKIYDMFFRANEKSSGSGLGLYIVKESLAKLNGDISINSTYGVGTEVNVQIPV